MRARLLLLLLIVACLALAQRGHEAPVRVDVMPRILMPKRQIRVVVWVERHASNRTLVTEVDGPTYSRSDEQLAGEAAPRARTTHHQLNAYGWYEIRATVLRQDGSTQRALETVCVVGGEQGCED